MRTVELESLATSTRGSSGTSRVLPRTTPLLKCRHFVATAQPLHGTNNRNELALRYYRSSRAEVSGNNFTTSQYAYHPKPTPQRKQPHSNRTILLQIEVNEERKQLQRENWLLNDRHNSRDDRSRHQADVRNLDNLFERQVLEGRLLFSLSGQESSSRGSRLGKLHERSFDEGKENGLRHSNTRGSSIPNESTLDTYVLRVLSRP
eukprot:259320-Prorocentrum_minimum.AAC.3